MTEETDSPEKIIHVDHKKRVEDGRREFNVAKVTGTGEEG